MPRSRSTPNPNPCLPACPQVSWSHLDIAGPVWDDKLGGATGFGAQTLAEWAIAQGSA